MTLLAWKVPPAQADPMSVWTWNVFMTLLPQLHEFSCTLRLHSDACLAGLVRPAVCSRRLS